MWIAHCVRCPQALRFSALQRANSRETARRLWRRGLFGIRLLAVRLFGAPLELPRSTGPWGQRTQCAINFWLGPHV